MRRNNLLQFITLFFFLFLTGCGGLKPMTVSQVTQNAQSLDGEIVRVRGRANLLTDPSQADMSTFGGCAPGSPEGQVAGWLILYDPLLQEEETGVRIAESSFHCEGDYCNITCSPFKVTSHEMYEFVGTLRVNGAELILENLDLEQSRQLIDAKWIPISTETFDVAFP